MHALLPAVLLSILALSCIEITSPEIRITAEPQPAELLGARWQRLPVHYCIAEQPSGFRPMAEFRELTERAFVAWGVEAVNDGVCAGGITRANGINEIGWGRVSDAQAGGIAEEAGLARTVFRQCNPDCGGARNEIVEVDIIIISDPPQRWRNSRCLYSTLLHEVGHFLGVPHLDSPAVMAPASASCPGELTEMDRAAIDRLYSR